MSRRIRRACQKEVVEVMSRTGTVIWSGLVLRGMASMGGLCDGGRDGFIIKRARRRSNRSQTPRLAA
jgi:hypothetical protein